MLLEFPHGHIIPGSDKLAQWLLARNIRPLIAHPERNKQLMKEPGLLRPFLETGCWLQLTAGSVLGQFGARAETLAKQLLDDDVVTVLASDGHNRERAPAGAAQGLRVHQRTVRAGAGPAPDDRQPGLHRRRPVHAAGLTVKTAGMKP